MKTKILFLAVILVISVTATFAQSVVITGKKVTYNRPKPESEGKKTFTINYPKVKAATPALSKKIESSISYSSVLKLNLKEELSEYQWLKEADYEVGYNKNNILSISLSMNGSAAYPSGTTKIVVIDLKTGLRLKPTDVFTNLPGLTALVRKSLKKETADSIVALKKDPENKDINVDELFQNSKFTAANLEDFSVDDKGVAFHYDYEFAHVIQALQPSGTFAFTWAQLKPYIKQGGLLSRFGR